ncbi:hypothetical protein G7068_13615 [Leucobacter viscericola]|uniref:Putative exodeoxyribonuclease 8 PDDEXK-like domain-containing protein n=1 Tax=Leucobacter viscericola TaxID=2714935 RepID=A0A6G7XI10_9MICO|nr:PD-(D/E)XK nuclease-like domain-containing protein [Leucobacter viscericola]QIK64116.1 hypothetical protein G7068_13615 [Leucobacter viscericola]
MSEQMRREGVVYGMPEAEYHAPRDELSSAGAKLILECAAKFKYQVIDGNRVHRPAFDLGTAVHTKVLGVGAEFIEYPNEHLTASGNVSTKAATVLWENEMREAGHIILTPAQALQADCMAEAVLREPESRRLFEREGNAEVSIFHELNGVKRRGRFDYLPSEGGFAVDLKTTLDASPFGFRSSVENFGYHIQYGHYTDILERITGEKRDMIFVVVEKAPPYLVNVIRFDELEDYARFGETEALEAVDRYRRCMESGEWPGYLEQGITKIKPSMRLVYDFQDKYESEEMQL